MTRRGFVGWLLGFLGLATVAPENRIWTCCGDHPQLKWLHPPRTGDGVFEAGSATCWKRIGTITKVESAEPGSNSIQMIARPGWHAPWETSSVIECEDIGPA